MARLPGDYVTPAFALWLGAHMWAYMSPHSYHVMQCLAASVPVMAGYAQTKRAAACGRLAAGMLPVVPVLPLADPIALPQPPHPVPPSVPANLYESVVDGITPLASPSPPRFF